MRKYLDGLAVEMDEAEVAEFEATRQNEPVALVNYQGALNLLVEQTAQGRKYNGAESCASYVTSGVPAWAAEAAAFVAWRDQVYLIALGLLSQVQSGSIPAPSLVEFMSQLPEIVWPE